MAGVAVITGASRGLGVAFARALASMGYELVLGARDVGATRRLAEEVPTLAVPLPLDVCDEASVERFAAAARAFRGRIDVVVCNAGIGAFRPLGALDTPTFDALFATNVRGAWLTTRAFLPDLEATRGAVVMVSSDVSTRVFPNGGAYCATKHALRALTRTFQLEHPALRFLELRPGATDTSFAGSSPGAPGKEWFLRPEDVARCLGAALALPADVRVEELVVRATGQEPTY